MIISGTKIKLLESETIPDTCTFCGNSNCVDINVMQKYTPVFCLPFVPIGKSAQSKCRHCKHTLEGKELPDSFQEVYQRNKLSSKAPVWMYSGLLLVFFLISFGVYSSNKNDQKNLQLVAAPQAGDVYHLRTPNSQYTLARVNAVKGDTVFLLWSKMETDKITGLSKILAIGNDAFNDSAEPILLSDLKHKLETDEIIDIER